MIAWTCSCGNPLEVPDRLAGGSIQCEGCGRLRSVPEAGGEDAAYDLGLDEPPARADTSQCDRRVHDLGYATAGTAAPAYADPPRPGENVPTGPVRRRGTTAFVDDVPTRPLWRLPADLFRPSSLIVMAMSGLILTFAAFLGMMAVLGAWPILLVFVVVVAVLVGHYVNVIDETGPEHRDELPPPLRDVAFWDDMLKPFLQFLLANGLCFGLSLLMLRLGGWGLRTPHAGVAAGLGVVGLIVFPMVLLTIVGGATVANLAPHRLVGAIVTCGLPYLAAIALFPLTLALHAAAAVGLLELCWQANDQSLLVGGFQPTTWWWAGPLTTALMLAATLAAHAFAWLMGRLFRRHVDAFPWLLMRHVPKPKPGRIERRPA